MPSYFKQIKSKGWLDGRKRLGGERNNPHVFGLAFTRQSNIQLKGTVINPQNRQKWNPSRIFFQTFSLHSKSSSRVILRDFFQRCCWTYQNFFNVLLLKQKRDPAVVTFTCNPATKNIQVTQERHWHTDFESNGGQLRNLGEFTRGNLAGGIGPGKLTGGKGRLEH